jgi:D-alanyl-lipoteichoic acid acyltransferase DltB (MBOAT superfamily)
MVYGFFMKLFVADNLAPFVDQVYDHPAEYLAPSFVIATVFFAFQIYCDFAGYSYIAIGTARVMGFRLMENFRQPYFSRSIGEFWRRWHISLSTWFKDYVYVPLGGSQKGEARHVWNLLVTFLLSGLWHGANWTYVIWGGLNGCYLVLETFAKKLGFRVGESVAHPAQSDFRAAVIAVLQTLFTFMLICLTWVFFRAESIQSAFGIIAQMFTGWSALPPDLSSADFYRQYIFMGKSDYDFYWSLGGIAILLVAEYLYIQNYLSRFFAIENRFVRYGARWFVIATALLLIIIFAKTESQQFIYFQF